MILFNAKELFTQQSLYNIEDFCREICGNEVTMMKYISTRGISRAAVSSATAIKQGLASDGGLFMPTEIPKINIDFFVVM